MPGHSQTKMSDARWFIAIGTLICWGSAFGNDVVERYRSLDQNRPADRMVYRSKSVDGVVRFSDFPGDCAAGGDLVTVSVTTPSRTEIDRHKEQYKAMLDLLDRMAEDRHKQDLARIERRQARLENALSQIRLDEARRQEPEKQYVRHFPTVAPYGIPARRHPYPQSYDSGRSDRSHSHHRFSRDSNHAKVSITPGIIRQPHLVRSAAN